MMDKYMAKLVSLGILSKNNTTHTSPVMLVARKGTKNKRPVVDFRLLNTRIMRRNTATPLLRDIFKMLGRSKCEVLSCVDLKDAFHSLGLTDKAKNSVVYYHTSVVHTTDMKFSPWDFLSAHKFG